MEKFQSNEKYTVDRSENGFWVLTQGEGVFSLPMGALPTASPGDVFLYTDGEFMLCANEREERKRAISERMNRLFKK